MERTSMIAERNLALPSELSYRLPSSKKSTISRREHISRSAEGTATGIEPGSTIVWTIPPASNKVLASNECYFSMTVKSSGAATLGGSVHNVIDRIRILTDNGSVLEDIQNYNVINRIVQYLHMDEEYLNDVELVSGYLPTSQALYSETFQRVGVADDAKTLDVAKTNCDVRKTSEASAYEAETSLAGSGISYFFRLEASGLLSTDKFFPLFAAGMRIELTLASAAIALRTGTEFLVDSPKIYYTLLTMNDQVAATMSQALRAGNLHLPYFTWAHKQASLGASDVSLDVNLSQPFYRVKNIYSVIRTNTSLAANQDSFAFNNTNLYSAGKGWQFKYADSYFPIDRVDSVKRAFFENKIALGQIGSVDCACLPYSDFASNNRHIICGNFESLMSDPFSGSSTKNSRNIELNMQWSSAPGASRVDSFTYFVRVLRMKGDGSVELLE